MAQVRTKQTSKHHTLADRAVLREALDGQNNTVQFFRAALEKANHDLLKRFHNIEAIESLVRDLALVVDEVILSAWEHFTADIDGQPALVAVGGYGRGELHPYSDVDLMILLSESRIADIDEPVSRFLAFLWDIGLEVGHSVRTPEECVTESSNDVTILTTLMEARLLSGPETLFDTMQEKISKEKNARGSIQLV